MTGRSTRRTPAALFALCLTLLIAAPGPAAAQSAPGPGEPPPGAVSATITDIGPPLTREPGSTVRLRATIANTSSLPATRIRWRLRIAAPANSRASLTTAFQDRGPTTVLWQDIDEVVDTLDPGGRREVFLNLSLGELDGFAAPSAAAVFPVRLEVTHQNVSVIAAADTFVLWSPAPPPTLRLGWLVPISEPPTRDASFAVLGEQLERSVSAGGRLDRVLQALEDGEGKAAASNSTPQQAAASPAPLALTLAIDAEVVESVRALAEGSARVDEAGVRSQRVGIAVAASWLTRLTALAKRYPVVALPYADADLVALVRAGRTADVNEALRLGKERLDAQLGIISMIDIAWPAGEVADPATAAALAATGVAAVVLDRLGVRRIVDPLYTPTAVSELDTSARRIAAVVPDAPVGSLAGDVMAGGPSMALAMQRLLAETLVIHQQRAIQARDLFVRFPRDWQPADPAATAQVLALPSTTPWLARTTLREALDRPERAPNPSTPRYSDAARGAELSADFLRAGANLRTEMRAFQSILAVSEAPPPGTTAADRARAEAAARAIIDNLDRARLAVAWSESVHLRRDPARRVALRSAATDVLLGLRSKVVVAVNSNRLTSTGGLVPIDVINQLETPVRVRVKVRSQKLGLTFGREQDITVPAARPGLPGRATVQTTFQAQTVGKFPVDAQLLTTQNEELGPASRITVSTTAYGRLALLVTGGAFVLLVLASLLRFVFRRRRGRGETPDDGVDPDGGDDPPALAVDEALETADR